MKDWRADYERHLDRGVSVYNVKGFAQKETLMWITHGYGFCLPVKVREVYVAGRQLLPAGLGRVAPDRPGAHRLRDPHRAARRRPGRHLRRGPVRVPGQAHRRAL